MNVRDSKIVWVSGLLSLLLWLLNPAPAHSAVPVQELRDESLQIGNGIEFEKRVPVDVGNARQTDSIQIRIPDALENGNTVPLVVSTDLGGVKAMGLFSDLHVGPIAVFAFGEGVLPYVSTRFRVGAEGRLYVVVRTATGDFYQTASIPRPRESGQSALSPCKTADYARSSGESLKVLIQHCMNPNNYIRELKVSGSKGPLVRATLSDGMSRNPFFEFRFNRNVIEPSVRVDWTATSGVRAGGGTLLDILTREQGKL